ncbi:unnamed protein product [Soboliphyme baturini]|uniref:Peptidase_M1_N domain-containing protein n=1 Tax=Soboliphyme baturini TaxID=241478 RepID=A0A183J0K9_9BILA|nr:unnamed protein product [Soboliphyme baturini]
MEIVPEAKRGVFVPLWSIIVASAVIVACFLVIGLGVYYGTHQEEITTTVDPTSPEYKSSTRLAETTSATTKPSPASWRLPRTVLPNSYHLVIQPYLPPLTPTGDPACFTFNASLTVSLRTTRPTDQVTMNLKDLVIKRETLVLTEEQTRRNVPFQAVPFKTISEYETVTFYVGQAMLPNRSYLLSFAYTGKLSAAKENKGFFWISYSSAGETK